MYHFATQLIASAALIVFVTVVHGLGVVGIANLLRLAFFVTDMNRLLRE